jgi:hypothetical protein
MNDRIEVADVATAQLIMGTGIAEAISPRGVFHVECYDADGNLKWKDVIHNLVTTVGKNDILDKYLSGSGYTQTVRMGLKGTGSAAAGDTQASHAGWLEVGGTNAPAFSGNRPSVSFNSASGGSKTVSAAVSFTFTSGGTVAGCFINNGGSATKDDTTGVLFSAGDFSGGSRTVVATDVINVTYTLSA